MAPGPIPKQVNFDASEMLGKVLDGRYRLDELLGYGGMGMVFRATQTTVKREVAIKTLNPTLAVSSTFFERFKREAEVASRLKHPNIVTIFDFGKTKDGICYISMELLDGQSLRQHVKAYGPMSLRRAAAVTEQIGLGLQHAHNAGCIHRDMKPQNVVLAKVDGAEYVKVLDFGLVKANEDEGEDNLTSTGQVLGTPQYMPPEQASGEPVDARSDLYALGAVFHFCLTGSSPYGANSIRKALTAALTQPVPSVASKRKGAPVPHSIENFLRKAMAKEPDDRYQSAQEFLDDLEKSLKGLTAAQLDASPVGAAESGKHSSLGRGTPGSRSRPLPKFEDESPRGGLRPTTPDVPSAKVSASSGSKATFVVIALLLIAAGGGFFVWKNQPQTAANPSAAVADSSNSQAPVASPENPRSTEGTAQQNPSENLANPEVQKSPSPKEETVSVTLKSSPPGADVVEDGVMLGKTPLSQRWPKDTVKTVTFQLVGFRETKRSFKLQADQVIEVELQSVKKAAKPKGEKDPTPFD